MKRWFLLSDGRLARRTSLTQLPCLLIVAVATMGLPQAARGGRAPSWLAVAKLQQDLYAAVKGDAALKKYPVWSISENGAERDNVGLQFLTIPKGAGASMPDGTKYADYANCHNYINHPAAPGL